MPTIRGCSHRLGGLPGRKKENKRRKGNQLWLWPCLCLLSSFLSRRISLSPSSYAFVSSGGRRWKAALYTRNPFLYKYSLMAVTLPDARERCSPIYIFRCKRIDVTLFRLYPYDSCMPTNSHNRSGTFLYRELVVLGLRSNTCIVTAP